MRRPDARLGHTATGSDAAPTAPLPYVTDGAPVSEQAPEKRGRRSVWPVLFVNVLLLLIASWIYIGFKTWHSAAPGQDAANHGAPATAAITKQTLESG